MCAANGWRAGCVAGVIAHRVASEAVVAPELIADTEQRSVATVIEATRRLLES